MYTESWIVIKIRQGNLGSVRKDHARSKVGNQLRVTTIMDRYENFKMREGEDLDGSYDRFVNLNNEMKKNKLYRPEFDQNVKFINNLLPEWKPYARFINQHKELDELKLY